MFVRTESAWESWLERVEEYHWENSSKQIVPDASTSREEKRADTSEGEAVMEREVRREESSDSSIEPEESTSILEKSSRRDASKNVWVSERAAEREESTSST